MSRQLETVWGESLVVTASLNAKPGDRYMDRAEVRPVQVIRKGRSVPVGYFDSWGELGVSSMAFFPTTDASSAFISTGPDLSVLDLPSGFRRTVGIAGLQDVHEVTLVGGELWIANTGRDEVVQVNPIARQVVKRLSLSVFRGNVEVNPPPAAVEGAVEVVDRFHCNQVFVGHDGRHYVLVHHAGGKQFLRHAAARVLKLHGSGGVVCLESGDARDLKLSAPHSATIVRDEYWICNSGSGTISRFDRNWRISDVISIGGWGRGATLSADGRYLYVGISAPRRRYRGEMAADTERNFVRVVETRSGLIVGEVTIGDVEQINNVYAIPPAVADTLLSLAEGAR